MQIKRRGKIHHRKRAAGMAAACGANAQNVHGAHFGRLRLQFVHIHMSTTPVRRGWPNNLTFNIHANQLPAQLVS
jgi:hypothetical protein